MSVGVTSNHYRNYKYTPEKKEIKLTQQGDSGNFSPKLETSELLRKFRQEARNFTSNKTFSEARNIYREQCSLSCFASCCSVCCHKKLQVSVSCREGTVARALLFLAGNHNTVVHTEMHCEETSFTVAHAILQRCNDDI